MPKDNPSRNYDTLLRIYNFWLEQARYDALVRGTCGRDKGLGKSGYGNPGKGNDGVCRKLKITGYCENNDKGTCQWKHPMDQWRIEWQPKGKGKNKGKSKWKCKNKGKGKGPGKSKNKGKGDKSHGKGTSDYRGNPKGPGKGKSKQVKDKGKGKTKGKWNKGGGDPSQQPAICVVVTGPMKVCWHWTKNAGCAKGDKCEMHHIPPCKDWSKDSHSCPRGKECVFPHHRMDGYTVAKAAAAKEKAKKRNETPPATTPPEKSEAKAKAKSQTKSYVALELAPHESAAGGDPSQTIGVLQGLATEQAAPAKIADE